MLHCPSDGGGDGGGSAARGRFFRFFMRDMSD